MKSYQVFDPDGKLVGSVSGISIADAVAKAREGYGDFPTLVELPQKMSEALQKLVEEKTALECFIGGWLEDQISKFVSKTGVPIEGIGLSFSHYTELGGIKMDPRVDVNIQLNINEVH